MINYYHFNPIYIFVKEMFLSIAQNMQNNELHQKGFEK